MSTLFSSHPKRWTFRWHRQHRRYRPPSDCLPPWLWSPQTPMGCPPCRKVIYIYNSGAMKSDRNMLDFFMCLPQKGPSVTFSAWQLDDQYDLMFYDILNVIYNSKLRLKMVQQWAIKSVPQLQVYLSFRSISSASSNFRCGNQDIGHWAEKRP